MREEDQKKLKGYVRIREKFLSKQLLAFVLILILALPAFAREVLIPIYHTYFGGSVFLINDEELFTFSGTAKVSDLDGNLLYHGEVAEGVFQGRGELYNKNGTLLYAGEFENFAYQGSGRLYDEDGMLQYKGEFENNVYQGMGTLYDDEGTLIYEGDFQNGLYNGEGILYEDTGKKEYAGKFWGGVKEGQGMLYCDNKLVYEGLFKEDAIDYRSWLGASYEDVKSAFKTREYKSGYAEEKDETEDDEQSDQQMPASAFEQMEVCFVFSRDEDGNAGNAEVICLWGEGPTKEQTEGIYTMPPEWMKALWENPLFKKQFKSLTKVLPMLCYVREIAAAGNAERIRSWSEEAHTSVLFLTVEYPIDEK